MAKRAVLVCEHMHTNEKLFEYLGTSCSLANDCCKAMGENSTDLSTELGTDQQAWIACSAKILAELTNK